MNRSAKAVKRKDHLRVLLTETSPYEVPAIFSNIGFYNNITHHNKFKSTGDIVSFLFEKNLNEDYTIPLTYKIKKDIDSSRVLSLIHPRSQLTIVDFYENFSSMIISSCQKSDFSLRSPSRISSKYFIKNNEMNDLEYSRGEIQSEYDDKKYKHLASYFSYNRYTRLHKFFNSMEFINLEKKFDVFCSIDVAKCFDSIYTHSITWAVKNKEFSKQNRHVKNSFGTIFDRLMQSINYNETAGILIGPEVSRIFSEVLFQDIDREVENLLGELQYLNGRDYTIRRYVDDIFIFTLNETILNDVKDIVEDTLKKYKLTVNKQKTYTTLRPFSTAKSGTINHLNEILNSLTSKFIDPENPEKVKKIYSKRNTVVSYLNKIKSMFVLERENYNLASGYTISSLTNIAIDLDRKCKASSDFMKNNERQISDFFYVATEIIFHLFFISPSHNSSVKICIFIDIVCKNVDGMSSGDSGVLKGLIFNLIHSYFERCIEVEKNNKIKKISLENLNLLIALKLLGEDYNLTRDFLGKIYNIDRRNDFSYFEIICLFYFTDHDPHFNSLKTKMFKHVKLILGNVTDIKVDSFKFYLLLDIINCPFIEESKRKSLTAEVVKFQLNRQPSAAEINIGWDALTQGYWFVQWDNFDLRLFLEKKELLSAY